MMTEAVEIFGSSGPQEPAKAGTKRSNGKPKKKGKGMLRSFTKSDIRELEKLLSSLESRKKVGKIEALMELAPSIIANIRKGWKPIEIAKVLKEQGRMASVRQTDVLRVLKLSFDAGDLSQEDVESFKLGAIFKVSMDQVPDELM
jgi:hypothetical protein